MPMDEKDQAFLRKLLATFRVEAAEHISAIAAGLVELEKGVSIESRIEIIEAAFRETHSMKGAARSVNMFGIEAVCRSLEVVFAALKRGDISLSADQFDLIHKALGFIGRCISSEKPEGDSQRAVAKKFERELCGITAVTEAEEGQKPSQRKIRETTEPEITLEVTPECPPPVHAVQVETIRISRAKLNAILLLAEEMLSAKQSINQQAVELGEIAALLAAATKEWENIRPSMRAVEKEAARTAVVGGRTKRKRHLTKLLEYADSNAASVGALRNRLWIFKKTTERDRKIISGMVDNLLDDMKKVLMLPFSSLFEVLPPVVRDLSRSQGKEVELVVVGEDIEIDRRMLEEMKDPLIHLLRNCIDHGIEKPSERLAKNKQEKGTISINVSSGEGGKIKLLVSDDGCGINISKVKTSAVSLGIISKGEADKLEDVQVPALIFRSGVSTSPIITDISGRGLGLAIVQEKVEKLGGAVSCEYNPGAGAAFKIVLPLTLATLNVVLVSMEGRFFLIPKTYVERVIRIARPEIKTVENRETISLDGRAIPVVSLAAAVDLPIKGKSKSSKEFVQVVLLTAMGKEIAFIVDEVLNEQEVLVKNLGPQLRRVRNILGASIFSTGEVVPIMNVPDLIKSAVKDSAIHKLMAETAETIPERKRILVAEDSITARTLLKNILEAAGYDVKTAVDGMDAYNIIKTEEFDLVVSDVDMPRMNGFDLTAKIRSDRMHGAMPLVLVTALDSREDRERGIDVGASAYIVKSSFDQSNLLEVIKRLI
jgi:two-component system, chemotaxis family, sensor kinase CheA